MFVFSSVNHTTEPPQKNSKKNFNFSYYNAGKHNRKKRVKKEESYYKRREEKRREGVIDVNSEFLFEIEFLFVRKVPNSREVGGRDYSIRKEGNLAMLTKETRVQFGLKAVY